MINFTQGIKKNLLYFIRIRFCKTLFHQHPKVVAFTDFVPVLTVQFPHFSFYIVPFHRFSDFSAYRDSKPVKREIILYIVEKKNSVFTNFLFFSIITNRVLSLSRWDGGKSAM